MKWERGNAENSWNPEVQSWNSLPNRENQYLNVDNQDGGYRRSARVRSLQWECGGREVMKALSWRNESLQQFYKGNIKIIRYRMLIRLISFKASTRRNQKFFIDTKFVDCVVLSVSGEEREYHLLLNITLFRRYSLRLERNVESCVAEAWPIWYQKPSRESPKPRQENLLRGSWEWNHDIWLISIKENMISIKRNTYQNTASRISIRRAIYTNEAMLKYISSKPWLRLFWSEMSSLPKMALYISNLFISNVYLSHH